MGVAVGRARAQGAGQKKGFCCLHGVGLLFTSYRTLRGVGSAVLRRWGFAGKAGGHPPRGRTGRAQATRGTRSLLATTQQQQRRSVGKGMRTLSRTVKAARAALLPF